MIADAAIARRSFRQLRTSAVVWALVFGGTVAASALTYVGTFPTQASRDQLAATTGWDAGVSMLLGPISSINTVGGYTVYKCFVTLTTNGAIWGLLAATRLLRGEEDSGRWQLALAGGTRPARATIATLTGIGGAVAVVVLGTAAITALAGRSADVGFSITDSAVYGLGIAIAPAVFVAIGAVTSQLGRSRRTATGLGMAVLGVGFVMRMMADSGPATRWLLWCTPFGWTERMRPITDTDVRPLALALLALAALVTTAAVLATRRDAGAGAIATRDVVPVRRFGLGSPLALTLRLELPVLGAWCLGAAAAAFSLGIVAKTATGSVPPSMTDLLHKFGVRGTFLRQYLGLAFLFVASIVALLPASQIGASADEETTGQLVNIAAQPTRRAGLLVGRLGIAAAAVSAAGLLSGLFAWLGARVQGVDPGLSRMLGAGLNAVPTALLVLGIGAVVRTVAPRAATASVYAVVCASFVIDLVASLVEGLRWTEHLSVFHYMALAPAEEVDPTAVVATLGAATLLLIAATVHFSRRDLQTG